MNSIKKWIDRIGSWVLNTILNFYLKNITSLSILYTLLFSISWLLCYYKFNNLQLEIINYNGQINKLNFNKKFLNINQCINDSVLVDREREKPPQEVIINIQETCIINGEIDINKLNNLVDKKKALDTTLAVWKEDFSIWQKFKIKHMNNMKNLIDIKIEEKNLKDIKEINNDITILKKTKIKLLFGLGLLIASDFLLKSIFC